MFERSLAVHNFAQHRPGHKLQRGMLLKMSGKVYTSQTHKLLHERDHTHTPKGQPKPHAHRDKHTQGEKLSAAVSTKPQSSHQTVVSTRHNTSQVAWAQTSVSNLFGTKTHSIHRHLNSETQIKERCAVRRQRATWSLHHLRTIQKQRKRRSRRYCELHIVTILLITRNKTTTATYLRLQTGKQTLKDKKKTYFQSLLKASCTIQVSDWIHLLILWKHANWFVLGQPEGS